MKIIHIIPSLGIGGTEKILDLITEKLKAHEHIIINLGNSGYIERSLKKRNHKIKKIKFNFYNFPISLLKILIFLRKENPEIIQSWLYKADLITIFIRLILNHRNIIWNIRGTKIQDFWKLDKKLCLWLLSKFSKFVPSRIICCGKKAMDEHISIGYPINKMIIIENGIDTEKYICNLTKNNYLREKLSIKKQKLILGCIGRYEYLKGLDNLIKGLNLIYEKNKSKIAIVLAGKEINTNNKRINNLIQETKNSLQFILLDEIHDVPQILQGLDFYCSPSRYEGFPNIIAEAMSAGIPCIVSDAGDSERIVGDAGICYGPSTPQNIAFGINKFLELNSNERIELGISSRNRKKENFYLKKMCNKYEKLYLSISHF